jgi:3-methyladenine DNA glycosylase AlkD
MTLAEVMQALEKAGSAQTRKTYRRHGAAEPMFGVSFATLGALVKRIGVDHDLALRLWDTGNFDARNLAFKIADPVRLTASDLDRWARETSAAMCVAYASMLAVEGTQGFATAKRWLASSDEQVRGAGWGVVSQLAGRDAATPDAWFAERLAQIERTIHAAPNFERAAMNQAVITIGGRSPALRKAALAAAKRIGKVEVDHGDTWCKTPDAGPYIEKTWAYAKSKGFDSPSAQERERESPRTRC